MTTVQQTDLASLETLLAPPCLIERIALAMSSLAHSSQDADREGHPYWHMQLLPVPEAGREPFSWREAAKGACAEMCHAPQVGGQHVTGRCLDALLYAEAVTGIPASPESLDNLTQWHFASYANDYCLHSCLEPSKGNRRAVHFHDCREGLLGLTALIRWRSDDNARRLARRMLETLHAITASDGAWDEGAIVWHGWRDAFLGTESGPTTSGRLVSALVKYYRATEDQRALELAEKYARYNLNHAFTKTGALAKAGNHVHSITSTVASLLEYGLLVKDRTILEGARNCYDNALKELSSSYGYCQELVDGSSARGEINQTGDLIQCALFLARAGWHSYYEETERILRSFLLPCQWVDVSFLCAPVLATEDRHRNLHARACGSFGFPLPNDQLQQNGVIHSLDVTAGALQALCECWQSIVVQEGNRLWINLLLSHETPEITVKSFLPAQGRLEATLHVRADLLVRIPPWMPQEQVTLQINGRPVQGEFVESYLLVRNLPQGSLAGIELPLPSWRTVERIEGVAYQVEWQGNQVIALSPPGNAFPLFPEYNMTRSHGKE